MAKEYHLKDSNLERIYTSLYGSYFLEQLQEKMSEIREDQDAFIMRFEKTIKGISNYCDEIVIAVDSVMQVTVYDRNGWNFYPEVMPDGLDDKKYFIVVIPDGRIYVERWNNEDHKFIGNPVRSPAMFKLLDVPTDKFDKFKIYAKENNYGEYD